MFCAGAGFGPLVGIEFGLADAHNVWGDLQALVFAAELKLLLHRELRRRDQALQLVAGGRAHVGEVLFFGGVDVHVVGARVFADDHALVGVLARRDEHRAALLQVEQGVGGDDPLTVGDHRATLTGAQFAYPGLEVLEDLVHDALTAGLGEELGAEADKATGWDDELHAHPAGAVVDHVHHLAFA